MEWTTTLTRKASLREYLLMHGNYLVAVMYVRYSGKCLRDKEDEDKKKRGFHYRNSGTGIPRNSNYMPRLTGATIDTPLLRNYQFRIAGCTIITNIISQEYPAEGRKSN